MDNSTTRYEGQLTSEVRIQLTDLVKAVALANMGKRPNIKKLCGIAIELLDNAQRYCSDGNVLFNWELVGEQLVISIENKSSKADALRLLNSVEAVNNMSPEEITAAFRAQLTNGEFGEKGGAGLGLLDIARKSQGLIQACIWPSTEDNYFCKSQVSTQLH
jgi:hypothetical protein